MEGRWTGDVNVRTSIHSSCLCQKVELGAFFFSIEGIQRKPVTVKIYNDRLPLCQLTLSRLNSQFSSKKKSAKMSHSKNRVVSS